MAGCRAGIFFKFFRPVALGQEKSEKKRSMLSSTLTKSRFHSIVYAGGKMKLTRICFLIFAIAWFTACSNTDKSGYPIITESKDNIASISNPNYPEHGSKRYSLVEELSIGSDEDENRIFIRPIKIYADRQGNIFLLDMNKCLVQMFDPSGKFIRNFGRAGRGPGEFSFPSDMYIDDQSQMIYILGNETRKVARFKFDGQLVDDVRIDIDSPDSFFVSPSGFYHIKSSYIDNNNDQIIKWQKFSLTDGVKHESIEFPATQRKIKNYGDTVISGSTPFDPTSHFIADSNGCLYHAFSDTFQVTLYDSNFQKISSFLKRDCQKVKIPDSEKNRFIDYLKAREKKKGMSFHIKDFSLPDVYPVILSMWYDDKGRILIRTPSIDEKIHIDIFSPEGVYLEEMVFHSPPDYVSLKYIFQRPFFRNGFIYSIVMDKNGQWFIKKYKILGVE